MEGVWKGREDGLADNAGVSGKNKNKVFVCLAYITIYHSEDVLRYLANGYISS